MKINLRSTKVRILCRDGVFREIEYLSPNGKKRTVELALDMTNSDRFLSLAEEKLARISPDDAGGEAFPCEEGGKR